MDTTEPRTKKKKMLKTDVEFLYKTEFLAGLSDEAKRRLLVGLKPVTLSAGKRLVSQGEKGECFYIIQSGSGVVKVERDGEIKTIAVVGRGETVGEIAVLTGERRSAHVDAQTDMKLWKIDKAAVESICSQYPEVWQFLTEVVAARFARSTVMADRTVGKYVINEFVGRGGWSIVYRGVHKTLNMPVAIKMLRHNLATQSAFMEEFQHEATTIASLNHENIVKVYDIEELFGTLFIVMEYVEGTSLSSVLRSVERLPLKRAVHILLQVCSGLGFAHHNGIVHGDVKPSNILIQEDDKVKILDFGLACTPGTIRTVMHGTPHYVAPEQIRRGVLDERSDIYSLGIAAYRIVTGRYAFQARDVETFFRMHLNDDIPDPRSVAPDLPGELCTFLARATRKEPEERYQNTEQIIHELRPLTAKLGVKLSAESAVAQNMKSLLLLYRHEHSDMIERLVAEFSSEINKTGAVLCEADYKRSKH
jgi:eukaryotic-like serine/threonine-protein kinase